MAVIGAIGSLGNSGPPFVGPDITMGDPLVYGLFTIVFAIASMAAKPASPPPNSSIPET